MSDYFKPRERYHNIKPTVVARHKFVVGANVLYRGASSPYRVTRHLPDDGQGLQYRIRSERDGQERVAVESALERAT